jgi:ribosomal protein S3
MLPKFLQEAPAILARRHSFPVRSPLVTKGSIGIIVKLSKPTIYGELIEEADEFNEEQEEEQQQLKQQR